jgi:hypothetical protein
MKWKLKEKLKSYKSNNIRPVKGMYQKLTNSIKRPNLRIMGIEEGEELQTKWSPDKLEYNERKNPNK